MRALRELHRKALKDVLNNLLEIAKGENIEITNSNSYCETCEDADGKIRQKIKVEFETLVHPEPLK